MNQVAKRYARFWLGFILLLSIGAGCAEVTQTAAPATPPPAAPAAQPPTGPVAEAPKWNPGDEWTLSSPDGPFKVKVLGFEGDFTITTSTSARCAGCKQFRDRNMVIVKTTGRDPVGLKLLDFPLFVGKTWDSRFDSTSPRGEQFTYHSSCRILAVEQIAVPAGRFEAYKIHCDYRLYHPWSWQGETMHWYAPKAKVSVKTSDLSRNFWTKPEFELTTYTLKD